MKLLTLVVQLLLAVAKFFGQQQDRATGAALQREQDDADEMSRVTAAADAGLEPGCLPDGPDPLDRDGTVQS